MAMMTGRVLLVCVLCVLWCGAGGVGCAERLAAAADIPVDSASGGGGLLETPPPVLSRLLPGETDDAEAEDENENQ
ncbi:hypothetical protein TcYC6_0058050 [Trypanosoma cruzi]|nr:hypothetical protein TcYC6_0056800 [Trypanosoma cruzi]KAF8300944.1 hypothetical protein TcYC6_0058050 [Trypanosoma cruzi]